MFGKEVVRAYRETWDALPRQKQLLFALALLTGCATSQPSCSDNPRNMNCMTGDQLERALSE